MNRLPLVLLALCGAATAQETAAPPTEAESTTSCASAQHRQFDFWLGDWTVTSNGEVAGTNRIESIHGGCAIAEHWTSASGDFSGSSLNLYDQARGVWHQTWVDTTGTLLQLDGGMQDGRMIMSGVRPGPGGAELTHRITWTPNEDGTVHQHWESRGAEGSWATVFEGLYRPAGTPE